MSLYRLQRFANGDGDPIDTSDAQCILSEFREMERQRYNEGIDTAINLIKGACYHCDKTLEDTLVCGLKNSKIK